VALGASLAESLASFAASSHDERFSRTDPLPAGRPIFNPPRLSPIGRGLARISLLSWSRDLWGQNWETRL
jgi:hypothetical protein